ncbi:MAG: hypothetical protein ABUL73_04620 [Alphaproteobacteria bacterium]
MIKTHPLATLIAARILGPFLIIAGIALISRRDAIEAVADTLLRDDALALIAGFLSVLSGLVIIALHDHWRNFTQIIITLLGWISLLRGVAVIFAPDLVRRAIAYFVATPQIMPVAGLIMALLGLWLAFVGLVGQARGADETDSPLGLIR